MKKPARFAFRVEDEADKYHTSMRIVLNPDMGGTRKESVVEIIEASFSVGEWFKKQDIIKLCGNNAANSAISPHLLAEVFFLEPQGFMTTTANIPPLYARAREGERSDEIDGRRQGFWDGESPFFWRAGGRRMAQGLSFANGEPRVAEEWADRWSSLIGRARTGGERYARACDVIREIGFAAGDAMNGEPPERGVPMYAFQLGLMNARMPGADAAEGVFNQAGRMAREVLFATLDPLGLPEDKAAVMRAFSEGVGDRVDAAARLRAGGK